MPTTPIGTTLADILLAIQDSLINGTVFTSDTCYISLLREPALHILGGKHCVVIPGVQEVIQDQVIGIGRYLTGMKGTVHVCVFSRASLDESQRANVLLTDASLGLLGAVHSTINNLQLEFLEDKGGKVLVEEPMRLIKQEAPVKYQTPDWTYVLLTWEVKYYLVLDTLGSNV